MKAKLKASCLWIHWTSWASCWCFFPPISLMLPSLIWGLHLSTLSAFGMALPGVKQAWNSGRDQTIQWAVKGQGRTADWPWKCCASLCFPVLWRSSPWKEGPEGWSNFFSLGSETNRITPALPTTDQFWNRHLFWHCPRQGADRAQHQMRAPCWDQEVKNLLCVSAFAPTGHLNTRIVSKRIYFLSRIILDISIKS